MATHFEFSLFVWVIGCVLRLCASIWNVGEAFPAMSIGHGCVGLMAGDGSSLKLKGPPYPRPAVKANPVSTFVVLGTPLSLLRVAVAEEQATQERSSG